MTKCDASGARHQLVSLANLLSSRGCQGRVHIAAQFRPKAAPKRNARLENAPFTWLSMRMQKEARAHLRTYCPTREPWTGISSRQGSSQCSARTQWKDDRAAYTQHAAGAWIFVIEPLHQSWGQQSSPRQLREPLALCSRSSVTPYHKRIRRQNNNQLLPI
jgi:hypothetical protein